MEPLAKNTDIKKFDSDKEKNLPRKRFKPGILTLGPLQGLLFSGGRRVEDELREKARKRNPQSRNRRSGFAREIVYQWDTNENKFMMRFYTSINRNTFITTAQEKGSAAVRIVVRDKQSKCQVEFVSCGFRLERDDTGWMPLLRTGLDRAFLFISRKRPLCPLCRKSEMEVRTGKNGQFWGCIDFPVCRGTKNLEREREEKNPQTPDVENTSIHLQLNDRIFQPSSADTAAGERQPMSHQSKNEVSKSRIEELERAYSPIGHTSNGKNSALRSV